MGFCHFLAKNNLPRVINFRKNGIFLPHTIRHMRVPHIQSNHIRRTLCHKNSRAQCSDNVRPTDNVQYVLMDVEII